MLNQQKKETYKNVKERNFFAIFILIILIFFIIILNPFSYLFPQNITSELSACYQSAQARYDCFLKQREGQLERAKAFDALRRSIQEEKEKIRYELINLEKKQRVKRRKEMMKKVEKSRLRNISHKGEKYFINFGYVIETSP